MMKRTNPYTETKDQVVKAYRRVHANSEQTHVMVLTVGEDDYIAVAYDIDPVEVEPLGSTVVGYDPTLEGITDRAQRWMQGHPKGILGGKSGQSQGSSFSTKIMTLLRKLNDYGNEQMQTMQEQDGGGN